MGKKFLIIVDMQNDFIDGALGSSSALAIVSDVVNVLDTYKGYERIFTIDTHRSDYSSDPESELVPIPHCIENTEGWLLRSSIARFVDDGSHLIRKSTFGITDWRSRLESHGYTADDLRNAEFVICGLCTDICVVSNATNLRTEFPDAAITLIENACAGTSEEAHNEAINVMKCHGIKIENLREEK